MVTGGAYEFLQEGRKQARILMRLLSPSRLLPAPARTMAGPLAALRLPGRGPLAMWQFHVSQAGRYRPGTRQVRRRRRPGGLQPPARPPRAPPLLAVLVTRDPPAQSTT